MAEVFYKYEIRHDGIRNLLGGLYAIALASAIAWLGFRIESLVPILVSLALLALVIRGAWCALNRDPYRIQLDSELLSFGWPHKPEKHKIYRMAEIEEIRWIHGDEVESVKFVMRDGKKKGLPFGLIVYPDLLPALRDAIEKHFPIIRSVDIG